MTRSEGRLLATVAGRGLADPTTIPIDPAIDWALFLRLASAHSLAPLVIRHLREEAIPPDVRDKLALAARSER